MSQPNYQIYQWNKKIDRMNAVNKKNDCDKLLQVYNSIENKDEFMDYFFLRMEVDIYLENVWDSIQQCQQE